MHTDHEVDSVHKEEDPEWLVAVRHSLTCGTRRESGCTLEEITDELTPILAATPTSDSKAILFLEEEAHKAKDTKKTVVWNKCVKAVTDILCFSQNAVDLSKEVKMYWGWITQVRKAPPPLTPVVRSRGCM